MKLNDILDQVTELGEYQVIFARRPWTLDSEAEIGELDDDSRVPQSVARRGLDYFLEAPVAWEVLEVFEQREATPTERRALLLFYAENDAYPDWAFETTKSTGGEMSEVRADYLALIDWFVDGAISVEEFQARYLELFKTETRLLAAGLFELLDGLFGDVDSFTKDPELLATRPDFYLDEPKLRERARVAADILRFHE